MNHEKHEEISTKLKWIAKIGKNQKINTSTRQIDDDTAGTSIARTWNHWIGSQGVTRDEAITFISDTIIESFSLLITHKDTDNVYDRETCDNIRSAIESARHGIENLKATYSDDSNIEARIETIIENINTKLKNLESDDIADSSFVMPPPSKDGDGLGY
jgi:hypothetical protein